MTLLHPAFLALSDEGGGLSSLFDVGQSSWLWTILIFLVALPFMWKVVFGPIARALDERELRAREAARAAEQAREETRHMQEAIQSDLEAARREAAKAVAKAKARAEAREREILAAAQEQAQRDRARAREEIERALSAAREELRGEAVRLGVLVAEKVLEREFAPADQERLVRALQAELAGD